MVSRKLHPGLAGKGTRAPDGPVVETVEDKFEFIAAGEAVAIIPAGPSPRPDLTTIPLHGVEPIHVVLATRAGERSRLVADFAKAAHAHLTGPAPAGPHDAPPARPGT